MGGYEVVFVRELVNALTPPAPVTAAAGETVPETTGLGSAEVHGRRVRLTGRVARLDVAARECVLVESNRAHCHPQSCTGSNSSSSSSSSGSDSGSGSGDGGCSEHLSTPSFRVDLSMVDIPVGLTCDDVVQIHGELRWLHPVDVDMDMDVDVDDAHASAGGSHPGVYLLARVCRHVPELDTVLFERAALARRMFLQRES